MERPVVESSKRVEPGNKTEKAVDESSNRACEKEAGEGVYKDLEERVTKIEKMVALFKSGKFEKSSTN